MSEFELRFDEPTVKLCGHDITMIMEGSFEFDRYKQIGKIYQEMGDNQFQEVCPVKSAPLYQALYDHLNTHPFFQERMDEIIAEQYGARSSHRSSAWKYQMV